MGGLLLGVVRNFDGTARLADVELIGGDADYLTGVGLAGHVTNASMAAGVLVVMASFGPGVGDRVVIGVWA